MTSRELAATSRPLVTATSQLAAATRPLVVPFRPFTAQTCAPRWPTRAPVVSPSDGAKRSLTFWRKCRPTGRATGARSVRPDASGRRRRTENRLNRRPAPNICGTKPGLSAVAKPRPEVEELMQRLAPCGPESRRSERLRRRSPRAVGRAHTPENPPGSAPAFPQSPYLSVRPPRKSSRDTAGAQRPPHGLQEGHSRGTNTIREKERT